MTTLLRGVPGDRRTEPMILPPVRDDIARLFTAAASAIDRSSLNNGQTIVFAASVLLIALRGAPLGSADAIRRALIAEFTADGDDAAAWRALFTECCIPGPAEGS
jgi:hypothetical protein